MAIVLGVDPGSNTTGLFMFNSETRGIYFATSVSTSYSDANMRIWDIARKVDDLLKAYPRAEIIGVESTVMRGLGNTTYQKMVGALVALFDPTQKIINVPNTAMKRIVGGAGTAEKIDVAHAVEVYFAEVPNSFNQVLALISQEDFDATDAGGIAIAALAELPKKKKKKRKVKA